MEAFVHAIFKAGKSVSANNEIIPTSLLPSTRHLGDAITRDCFRTTKATKDGRIGTIENLQGGMSFGSVTTNVNGKRLYGFALK